MDIETDQTYRDIETTISHSVTEEIFRKLASKIYSVKPKKSYPCHFEEEDRYNNELVLS